MRMSMSHGVLHHHAGTTPGAQPLLDERDGATVDGAGELAVEQPMADTMDASVSYLEVPQTLAVGRYVLRSVDAVVMPFAPEPHESLRYGMDVPVQAGAVPHADRLSHVGDAPGGHLADLVDEEVTVVHGACPIRLVDLGEERSNPRRVGLRR